jgi:hypothetical protein
MKILSFILLTARAFAIYGGLPIPQQFPIPVPVVQITTEFHCSAIILNKDTLVTAGHCTETLRHTLFEITVKDPTNNKSYVTPVAKVVRHPQYKLGFKNHPTIPTTFTDLAVIKLAHPIPFPHSAATLPPNEIAPLNQYSLWFVANGKTRTHASSPNQSLPTTATQNAYKSWSIKAIPKKSGPCEGDSGGGYFEIQGNEAILFAIQSTRTSDFMCDDERSTSFAVDIHSSLVWITPLL